MERFLQRFVGDDAGGAATDWIVLVLGVVMLSVAMFSSIDTGTNKAAAETGEFMSAYNPKG